MQNYRLKSLPMTCLSRNVSEFDELHLMNNDVGRAGVQSYTESLVT